MITNTEGIVLRQRKIANNRRIIVLFTKQYGKLSAGTSINEKSRSRSALALRPFTHADYELFKGRETYSINSATVKNSFYPIGEDLDRFEAASTILEYLDKVLDEGMQMPALFNLTRDFLESVSKSHKSCETLQYAFIVKSLKMLGVKPELSCCVNCGKSTDKFGDPRMPQHKLFSVAGGGIICEECAAHEKTNGNSLIYKPSFDIIEVFRYFESKPLKTFEKIDLKADVSKDIREILADYTNRYLSVDVLRNRNSFGLN